MSSDDLSRLVQYISNPKLLELELKRNQKIHNIRKAISESSKPSPPEVLNWTPIDDVEVAINWVYPGFPMRLSITLR